MFAVSVAIGFMLSTFSSDVVQSYAFLKAALAVVCHVAASLLPNNAMYPIHSTIWRIFRPTTYAAEIMHSATGFIDISLSNLVIDWVVLLAVSGVIFFIAVKKNRWKDI